MIEGVVVLCVGHHWKSRPQLERTRKRAADMAGQLDLDPSDACGRTRDGCGDRSAPPAGFSRDRDAQEARSLALPSL
jgi:hypothetical protein